MEPCHSHRAAFAEGIREFRDWVHKQAVAEKGANPGRTANKARENLRAVLSCTWEQHLLETLLRFPPPREQRDVGGRHYLTKSEINSLYFATYQLKRPRGWSVALPTGRYWPSALALFFNYGLDTGTILKSTPIHEPILWRHITWDQHAPDGRQKDSCRWGWIYLRRVKTGNTLYRPMNRVVHEHIRNIMPQSPEPNDPVFRGGGCRHNATFVTLYKLAGIRPKLDIETGQQVPWHLKDLRKTCVTYYDDHIPESSIGILGPAVGGITYRHYAHRNPLAFRAIITILQPSAFLALVKGHDGECPCCRRPIVTADLRRWR